MNKHNVFSLDELKQWKIDPLINPRTKKTIKLNGPTFKIIKKEYDRRKDSIKENNISILNQLIICDDDRDPISMNLFWIEKEGIKSIVYPLEDLNNLVFYTDTHNKIRCLEKDTISHLKSYNILIHPVSMELIPEELFEKIIPININNNISIDNFALNVFQLFTKKSIFIDYKLFMALGETKLYCLNNEIRDIWIQNLSLDQRESISERILFNKTSLELHNYKLEDIQRYFLEDIKASLECDEELLIMVNYIIIGVLGIVIPEIKENYSDIMFAFS